MKKLYAVALCLIVFTSCKPLPHHAIHEDIFLKDRNYIHIQFDLIVETPEALKEVQLKSDKLAFALRLALREHTSTELKGRGKGSVLYGLQSIAKQVLDHPVKQIKILEYTFYSNTDPAQP